MTVQVFAVRTARLAQRCSMLAIAAAAVLAAVPAATAPQPAISPWGIPFTDVTPDPAIHYGRLPNGMRYAIIRNATPPGTASIRLRFGFGSIGEAENERGLAHFIEHMAFNGTTHVPEGEMVKILERQGLAFGPDTNALTGFDTTIYLLELPKVDTEHLDTAFFLLREVAGEVKFDPAAVDRERGVILGEKRARDSFQLDQVVDLITFQMPQTPYPNRIPIGTDQVIKTASAATLRNLYRRYYRPENATLVFAGDVDPAVIEARIAATFGTWKGVGPAGAPLPRGKVDISRPASFDTFVDPAVATAVDYTIARPWSDPPDTIADRNQRMLEGLALEMLNRRFQRLVNVPNSPILAGTMMIQEERDAALLSTLKVTVKDGAWKEAIGAAEQEIRRAVEHGFNASELRTVMADIEGMFRSQARQADTRTNQALADAVLPVVDDNDFVTAPQYRLDRFMALSRTVTPQNVSAAFRELWTGSAPMVHVSTKQAIPTAELASVFSASRRVAVAAPPETTVQQFAYDSFGKPGTIVADTRIADLGVRTVRFANNVRLNIKKTDFESGKVRFIVRLGGGVLDLPLDKPGLGAMLTLTSSVGALKRHSIDDLKELAAGRMVTFGSAVTENAFISTGSTTPRDLALQMKMSAAYLTDPGFRPEAASQWANALPIFIKQLDSQPMGVAQARLPILLAGGDQRFGIPDGNALSLRNFEEAKAALAPVIASAPIEVTIVGDVVEASAIDAVAATFGALPQRNLTETPSPEAKRVSFRHDRTPIRLTHDGPIDQAVVEAAWATTDDSDFRRELGVELLKDVLDLMLTESVRERLGDSYGVSLESRMSESFPGFGYLAVNAVVAPEKADQVFAAIDQAVADLRDKPISADLMARARNPEIEQSNRALRDNAYWLAALSQAQSDPERLRRIRERRQILESITPAELQQLAKQYLGPDAIQRARILSSRKRTTASR